MPRAPLVRGLRRGVGSTLTGTAAHVVLPGAAHRDPGGLRIAAAGRQGSGTVSGGRHASDRVRLNAGVDHVCRQVPKLDMAALRGANKQVEGSFRWYFVALDQDADRLADGSAS